MSTKGPVAKQTAAAPEVWSFPSAGSPRTSAGGAFGEQLALAAVVTQALVQGELYWGEEPSLVGS